MSINKHINIKNIEMKEGGKKKTMNNSVFHIRLGPHVEVLGVGMFRKWI